jgi:hypothetical protein
LARAFILYLGTKTLDELFRVLSVYSSAREKLLGLNQQKNVVFYGELETRLVTEFSETLVIRKFG